MCLHFATLKRSTKAQGYASSDEEDYLGDTISRDLGSQTDRSSSSACKSSTSVWEEAERRRVKSNVIESLWRRSAMIGLRDGGSIMRIAKMALMVLRSGHRSVHIGI